MSGNKRLAEVDSGWECIGEVDELPGSEEVMSKCDTFESCSDIADNSLGDTGLDIPRALVQRSLLVIGIELISLSEAE
jgi:hypothetical protein